MGSFSQSVFHVGGMQAFSCTLAGTIVVLDVQKSGAGQPHAVKATKFIPLQKDGITVMRACGRYAHTFTKKTGSIQSDYINNNDNY